MWQTKLIQQFSFSQKQSSEEEIANEALKLLTTENLDEEIQFDINNIANNFCGNINDIRYFHLAKDSIGNYFYNLKARHGIYDCAVSYDEMDRTITVHYQKTPSVEAMILTVKII